MIVVHKITNKIYYSKPIKLISLIEKTFLVDDITVSNYDYANENFNQNYLKFKYEISSIDPLSAIRPNEC